MSALVSPTVERVLRGELCAGCGLCAALSNSALEMVSVSPGYDRPYPRSPYARLDPATEKVISQSCPGAVVEPWPTDAIGQHPTWGPHRQVLTGQAADPAVRYAASSGGAISALLIYALRTGMVDRVVHIGVGHSPTRNAVAVSTTAEEVLARSGSRYTASATLVDIDAQLSQGGRFAFVGKPCDASALRRLARHDHRVAQHVPLIISFFCGGIPSHDGVERILTALGVERDAVTAFRFRGQGWPGNCVAETEAGEASMSYEESWGAFLSKEVQFRCKICPDSVGGVADIACADAWFGDEDGYPSFTEAEGRSLIVARTELGDALVSQAVAAGALRVEACPISDIDLMQPSQARRKRLVRARTSALPVVLQPVPTMAGLMVNEAARVTPLREAVQNFLGVMRRTFSNRRSRL
jgi:coenzyme F420 hydrogenase subunit beta